MITTIVIIVLILIILFCIVRHYELKIKKEKNKISFKESLDLVDLPIVTLYNNNEKFNFLLDTGSTDSHLAASIAHKMVGERLEYGLDVVGYGATERVKGIAIKALLFYKEKGYESLLHISDSLDKAFEEVKATNGVQIHGLLGSDFLQKHKYVLDFAELIAYSK